MTEIRVENWNDLLETLYAGAWNDSIQRYRSPFAFRGVSDNEYSLETTLRRLQGDFVKLEPHLLRNFRKYAHRDVVEADTVWHWLSVAQHHGLPTRLLDWTYSPFVALHFATANLNKFDRDGAIWMVNFVEAHRHLPEALRLALDTLGAHAFDVEILSQMLPSLEQLDAVCPDPFVIFFEPPALDDRIVNQFALFSTLSNPTALLKRWLEDKTVKYRKVIISAGLKWEIRDKLDQANITERVLFPGLDGLSTWLKRHYSPIGQNPDRLK